MSIPIKDFQSDFLPPPPDLTVSVPTWEDIYVLCESVVKSKAGQDLELLQTAFGIRAKTDFEALIGKYSIYTDRPKDEWTINVVRESTAFKPLILSESEFESRMSSSILHFCEGISGRSKGRSLMFLTPLETSLLHVGGEMVSFTLKRKYVFA